MDPLRGPCEVQGEDLAGVQRAEPPAPEALGFLHFNMLKRAYFGVFLVTLSGPFCLNYSEIKPNLGNFCQH